MDFRTKIEIPQSEFEIDHQTKLLMIGSCFIENIGELLIQSKFNVNLNPFGILYNPQSIAEALNVLLSKKQFDENDLFEHKELYHSFLHHSRFSDRDKEQCLSQINKSLKQGHEDLIDSDILFITFGTSYVYRLRETGKVVGNCHKLPANQFCRYRLNVESIVSEWAVLIKIIHAVNPKLKILFTVSPIRHLKDGAHENQLSKSTLLLAIDEICKMNKKTAYFPSYEIVLDELRDYRFYNADMIHPSTVAVKYIWERFSDIYFSARTVQIMNEWNKIRTAIHHRPFNVDTEEYKHFLKQTMLRLKDFTNKYPYICCNDEISLLTSITDIKD